VEGFWCLDDFSYGDYSIVLLFKLINLDRIPTFMDLLPLFSSLEVLITSVMLVGIVKNVGFGLMYET
jgi:hypothetical protein